MKKTEILKIINKEIKCPQVGAVEQFLEVHEIETKNGHPIILNIKNEKSRILVYMPVKKEKFYYVFCIDKKDCEVNWGFNETYSKLSFYSGENLIEEISEPQSFEDNLDLILSKIERNRKLKTKRFANLE